MLSGNGRAQMQPAEEDKGSLKLVIEGNVARVVLKNALESIPDSLDFRLSLLDMVKESTFPGIDSLSFDLFSDLEVGSYPEDLEVTGS